MSFPQKLASPQPVKQVSSFYTNETFRTVTEKVQQLFDIPSQINPSYAFLYHFFNPLTPNDLYISRTTPLTSTRCILYIYSTNVGTEYFKHALYSPFFSSKCSLFYNTNLFGSCIIHILYTECSEIKKKIIPAPKG